jgi:hypothetical protein
LCCQCCYSNRECKMEMNDFLDAGFRFLDGLPSSPANLASKVFGMHGNRSAKTYALR